MLHFVPTIVTAVKRATYTRGLKKIGGMPHQDQWSKLQELSRATGRSMNEVHRDFVNRQLGNYGWRKWRFKLFGETNIIWWIIGACILVPVLFWGTIAVIVGHFVIKFW